MLWGKTENGSQRIHLDWDAHGRGRWRRVIVLTPHQWNELIAGLRDRACNLGLEDRTNIAVAFDRLMVDYDD